MTIIYIIDDDKEFLDSLCWLVESVGYRVQTYTNANFFLEDVGSGEVDIEQVGCIVLDVRLHGAGMSGLGLQNKLIDRDVKLPIIFITGHADVPMSVSAMKLGAVDFLTKPINSQRFLESISHAISLHENYLIKRQKKLSVLKLFERLTVREVEVMLLMVKGKFTKVIASELGISNKTVEFHRAKVMKKTEARCLAELVRMSVFVEQ